MLYVGEDSGHLEIYDLMRNKCVRSIKAHYDRIGCIENISHSVFLTGSKDRCVKEYDIRLEKPLVGCFLKHEGEICGMSAMDQAIASGSNDNKVLIWDLRSIETVMNVHRHHSGAVKAIKWCPWRSNVLATGGGNKDRQVILWNSLANEVEERLDVKSQVTSLGWRSATKELVTSHSGNRNGYALIWDTKSKKLTHKLIGQSRRMLSLVLNPNNENELCSLGADETMRFWVIKSNREQPHRKLDDQSHLVASNYLVK